MKAKTSLTILLAAASLAALGSPAGADLAKFYSGQNNAGSYDGPFTGAGTVFNATIGLGTNCPTAACPNSDVISTPQNYAGTPITGTATTSVGGSATTVWGDFQPNFGGLGVGVGDGGTGSAGIDQIDGTEVLHLAFAAAVTLNGVGTLFASGHETNGTFGDSFSHLNIAGGNSFLLSLTGLPMSFSPVTFGTSNTIGGINFSGSDFYFMQNPGQPQFYVSALSYVPVPGPIVGAGLPGLILAALGMFGLSRRRRRA